MKRFRSVVGYAALGCAVLLLAGCMPIPPEPDPEPYAAPFNSAEIAIDPGTGAEVVSTQILVRFNANTKKVRRESIIENLGCSVVGRIPELDVFQLRLPSGLLPWEAVEQMSSIQEILWVEMNLIAESDAVEIKDRTLAASFAAEPEASKQWTHSNTGQANGEHDADLDIPEAWMIESGDSRVCIAIVDSGVNYRHEDLQGSLASDSNGGLDLVSGDGDALDEDGHGTAMTGVAVGNVNKLGIAGVAPGASFFPVRVMDEGKGDYFAITAAMSMAVRIGNARIINMSLSTSGADHVMQDMVARIAGRGDVLLVASAGNKNEEKRRYPSALPGVISVAATDNEDKRSVWIGWLGSGSNYGAWVDISAPGGSGVLPATKRVRTTSMDGGYGWTDGTSSATAFVSGVAALIWSLDVRSDDDYDLSAADVRSILVDTADPISDPGMGSGRVNACRALIETLRRLDIEETHKPFYVESANDLYMFVGIQGSSDVHLGTLKTATGGTPTITDIAWVDSKCALYAVSFDQLYQIDLISITLDPIGTGLGSSDVNALSADANGNLYAMTVDGQLLRVNKSTGNASRVGELGISITGSGDLAFSPGGSLYGAVRFSGSANDELVEVDTSNGSAHRIGSIGYDAVFGLFFVGEDLYGVTADSELIAINTSTGTGAFIRDLSFSAWGAQNLGE